MPFFVEHACSDPQNEGYPGVPVNQHEPLSEMGAVSDHREESIAFGRVLGT